MGDDASEAEVAWENLRVENELRSPKIEKMLDFLDKRGDWDTKYLSDCMTDEEIEWIYKMENVYGK